MTGSGLPSCPGCWPLALALLALALVARAVRGRSDPAPPPPAQTRLLMSILALLIAYALVMPRLGFLAATPVLLGVVLVLLGIREIPSLIFSAVGITLALYLVFGRVLGVLLPPGPLGRG